MADNLAHAAATGHATATGAPKHTPRSQKHANKLDSWELGDETDTSVSGEYFSEGSEDDGDDDDDDEDSSSSSDSDSSDGGDCSYIGSTDDSRTSNRRSARLQPSKQATVDGATPLNPQPSHGAGGHEVLRVLASLAAQGCSPK
jgi:hypothetical protein